MKKLLLLLAVLMLVQLAVVSVAYAQAFSMARKAVVANQLMFIPRVGAGGFTAQERADKVNERIATIIGTERLDRNNIWLMQRGNSYGIMVGNHLLYTVTASDARANHTRTLPLARLWLRNVRAALPESRPPAA